MSIPQIIDAPLVRKQLKHFLYEILVYSEISQTWEFSRVTNNKIQADEFYNRLIAHGRHVALYQNGHLVYF